MPETQATYYHSPVGLLKISGTDDYITEIIFNDKVQRLDVRKRNLSPMLIQCVEQLIQYFNGERRKFELPIHQQGSPFQQSVWAELMAIPFGKTISYINSPVVSVTQKLQGLSHLPTEKIMSASLSP